MKRFVLVVALLITLETGRAPTTAQNGSARPPITPSNATQLVPLSSIGRGTINHLAWSPDYKTLAVAGSLGVWLCDLQDSQATPQRLGDHEAEATGVAFSPDGQLLAWGEPEVVWVWSLATHTALMALEGHAGVSSLAFSPDGTRLASGDNNGIVRIWEVTTGKLLAQRRDHAWTVFSVGFGPDGQQVISVGMDGSGAGGEIPVWNIATNTRLALFLPEMNFYNEKGGSEGGAQAAAFAQDGKTVLLAGGRSGYWVQVWDVETGSRLSVPVRQTDRMTSVVFSSDTRFMAASGENNTIQVWKTDGGLQSSIRQDETIENMVFSPDGQQLAAVSKEGLIRLWNVDTGSEAVTLRHWIRVTNMAFDLGGRRLACVMSDGTLWVVDAQTTLVIDVIAPPGVSISSAAFSPDGHRLALGGRDGTVWLWDTAARSITPMPGKQVHPVTSVTFSPDGKLLISGSRDRSVQIWDVATGTKTDLFGLIEDTLFKVVFSRDGQFAVLVSMDGSAQLYDVMTGTELSRIDDIQGTGAIVFSPTGQRVLFQLQDYPGSLWNIENGTRIALLTTPKAALSPDWQLLAVAEHEPGTPGSFSGNKTTIRFWNVATGDSVAVTGSLPGEITDLAFSPDGTLLLSTGSDSVIQVWGIPQQSE